MTEKQDRILQTALTMFARNGYDATSTSKVARAAGVSEGLIFRHFASKEGLLEAIMAMGYERLEKQYNLILSIQDPREALRVVLTMPFRIDKSEHDFWRLMYSLKWQAQTYDSSVSAPMRNALIRIFTELKYENPVAEADLVMLLMDGIATSVLLKNMTNTDEIMQVILNKYDL